MPQPIDLTYAFNLKPEKAIKYFRSKGYAFSWNWQDTLKQAHAKAFTVARVVRADVLQDVRNAVDNAIAKGLTFQQFRKNLEPTLKKKDWWGRKIVVNPQGQAESILEGSPHRLRTIYNTNLASAYAVGREERFQENKKNRPYGQYVAVLDDRVRPAHAELHGKVFPLDDPFWDTFTPPLDFNCRCSKRSLSKRDVGRRKLKVLSTQKSPPKGASQSGKMIRSTQTLVNKSTGEVRQVKVRGYQLPNGKQIFPQPSFDYNPYKAAYQPDLNKYDYDIAKQYVKGTVTGPAFRMFVEMREVRTDDFFPIAVIPTEIKKALGTNTQTVRLSADTVRDHPGIKVEDYSQIQDVIDEALVVRPANTENHLEFIYKENNRLYMIPIKVTKDGTEVYVKSFHRIQPKQKKKKISQGTIVRE